MRPIPLKLRAELSADPFMKRCIYNRADAPNHYCRGRITFEHAWIYAGKQINEAWAIVGCCESHNSGEAMVKDYNRYRAIIRADIKDLQRRMPKKNWLQIYKYLTKKYGGNQNHNIGQSVIS